MIIWYTILGIIYLIAWIIKAFSSKPAVVQPQTRHIPQSVKIAVSARDGARCRYCHTPYNLQYDHIIPYSKGGSNEMSNIQLLCGNCNRRKSDRMLR